ncbi:MAG: hypothetical protein U0271_03805 [Polyangiaceae bacterium]
MMLAAIGMLIGHYAPALLLQRARPSVPLPALFVAAQLVDLAWALLVLMGVEHLRIVRGFSASNDLELYDMPWTHSLASTPLWVLAAVVGWRAFRRGPAATVDAAIVGLTVSSHFLLDFVVHVKDLPVAAAQGPKLGLGLWNAKAAAVLVECGLFAFSALAWWWPRRAQPGAKKSAGLLAAMFAFAVASFFIPAPPTPAAMAASGLATWIVLPLLAAWATRALRSESVVALR